MAPVPSWSLATWGSSTEFEPCYIDSLLTTDKLESIQLTNQADWATMPVMLLE